MGRYGVLTMSNTDVYGNNASDQGGGMLIGGIGPHTIDGSSWDFWELMGYYTGADWPVARQFGALNIDGTNSGAFGGSPREIPVLSDAQERPDQIGVYANGRTEEFGFGSPHPGTFSAVMGDGSTHSISNTANLLTLDSIGKREDGLVLTLQDLE